MLSSLASIDVDELASHVDQHVVLYGVPWAQYEALLAARGESAVPRMSYLEGTLELMSPSNDHERIKKSLARLLEAWADHEGIDLVGYGSWTVRSAPDERGLEPDECYIVGVAPKERPDLAIEVDWTRGRIDKLAIYQGLGVPEVWRWRNGSMEVHVLGPGGYRSTEQSALLPTLDLKLMCSFVLQPNQPQAVRSFRAALGG
jgi:Uma2 family endonuclease